MRTDMRVWPLVILGAVAITGLVGWLLFLMIRVTMIRGQRSAELRCPNCNIRDVRPSFQQGLMDAAFGVFSCVPYRCRACEARFYRYEVRKRDLSDAA